MNGEEAVLKAMYSLHEATEMHFKTVDARFDAVDKRLDGVDKRLDGVDKRLDGVDTRLAAQETWMSRLERVVLDGFDEMRAGFAELKDQLGRRRGSR